MRELVRLNFLKCLLVFFGLCHYLTLLGQVEKVPYNYLSEKGEKHGYWKLYVDSNLNKVTDTTKAVWFYYQMFYNGKHLIGYDNFIRQKDIKKVKFLRKPIIEKGKILPINGIFEVKIGEDNPHIDKTFSGKLVSVEGKNLKSATHKLEFKSGHLVNFFTKYGQYGTSWERMNYEKKYNNNPYSYYCEFPASVSGRLKKGYYFFAPNKKNIQRDIEVFNVESTRYDADISTVFFNGKYKGEYEARFQSSYQLSSPITLAIDSGRFLFEDNLNYIVGNFNVSDDTITFVPLDITKKNVLRSKEEASEFLILNGSYQIIQEKKTIFLVKKEETKSIKYAFRRHVFYR